MARVRFNHEYLTNKRFQKKFHLCLHFWRVYRA